MTESTCDTSLALSSPRQSEAASSPVKYDQDPSYYDQVPRKTRQTTSKPSKKRKNAPKSSPEIRDTNDLCACSSKIDFRHFDTNDSDCE